MKLVTTEQFMIFKLFMISNFVKIVEKIIKSRLTQFLEQNKILSKNQFGFRPGLETDNALYSVTKCMYDALDNSKKTITIFLDLAKAFDMVDHSKLIKILSSFGLKNYNLNWIKSYLDKRKQKAIINDTSCEKRTINCGVSQDSIYTRCSIVYFIHQ